MSCEPDYEGAFYYGNTEPSIKHVKHCNIDLRSRAHWHFLLQMLSAAPKCTSKVSDRTWLHLFMNPLVIPDPLLLFNAIIRSKIFMCSISSKTSDISFFLSYTLFSISGNEMGNMINIPAKHSICHNITYHFVFVCMLICFMYAWLYYIFCIFRSKLSLSHFLCSCISCFIVKLCPHVSTSCFYVPPSMIFPPSSVFPFLCFICPFPASLHLYLIPSLVCLYIVFVLPHIFVSLFRLSPWCHPVFPIHVMSSGVCPWYVSVVLFLVVLIDLYFAFVCILFQPLLLLLCFFVLVTRLCLSGFFSSHSALFN